MAIFPNILKKTPFYKQFLLYRSQNGLKLIKNPMVIVMQHTLTLMGHGTLLIRFKVMVTL